MKDFLEQLRDDHSNFLQGSLDKSGLMNPFDLFREWYKEVYDAQLPELNAFTLSTVSADGKPSARIVYLKELFDDRFIFYTNYLSQKGRELAENPFAAMLFFWREKERQVRIEGRVSKVDDATSDSYFASRPRGSRIGAWASHQSELLESRDELEKRVAYYEEKFPGDDIPRPPFWGGYALEPELIEFWQGRKSRLHDRIIFKKQADGSWEICRKNP